MRDRTEVVRNFYNKQREFSDIKKAFDQLKKSFEKEMELVFAASETDSISFSVGSDCGNEFFIVKRRCRTYIKWNFQKLAKNLGNKLFKQVVNKKYIVNDMLGLIEYLKSCNVDPNIFKKYIDVECSLNEAELDNLELLGKVKAEQLEGCFNLSFSKPWFSVEKKE